MGTRTTPSSASVSSCGRRTRRSARGSASVALLLALLVLVGGCGGGAGEEATSPATTAEEPPATTPEAPPPTTTATEASTPREIVIVVDQGRPRGGIKRPEVEQGVELVLVIRADVGESVHVHGYDVEQRLTPGVPARIPITATLPGRFEVELHHPDALLAVLEVRP